MEELTILIKPASNLCNLRCRYCFYFDLSEHWSIPSYGVMNEEVMGTLIKKAVDVVDESGVIHFIFQGGEPTLAGIMYYQKFIAKVNAYKKNQSVSYSIQTNGVNLEKGWFELFKKHDFLVGISLDGHADNMDRYRLDPVKNGVYKQVMQSIQYLKQYEIRFNVLTVLTSELSKNAKKLYTFYQKNNIKYVQLIPCLPKLDVTYDEHALKPSQYKRFFIDLFNLWKQDIHTSNYVDINIFTNIFMLLHRKNPYQCGITGSCALQYIVEANGDVYPCDFYVLEAFKLGNVATHSYLELKQSDVAKKFLCKRENNHPLCLKCRYIKICNGGCKRQNITFLDQKLCAYQALLDEVFAYIEKSNA